MPKRSRSGVVSSPVRVVAPIERERRQVERQRSRRRPLADDDVEPEVLERRVEDLLDRAVQPVDLVDEEDVVLLEAVRIAAMSPLRSIAGPATVRMPTPSSPGRCRRATSCRARAGRRAGRGRAPRRAPWPPRARSTAAPSRAPGRRSRRACAGGASGRAASSPVRKLARDDARHAARLQAPAARAPRAAARGRRPRARARPRRAGSRARRARRGRRDPSPARATSAAVPSFSFSSSTTRCGRLLADAWNRLEARGVLERDRAAQVGGRRAGDDRERHLRADAVDAEQVHEEVALLASSRSRRAAARPRGRGRYVSTVSSSRSRGAAPTASPGRGSRRR